MFEKPAQNTLVPLLLRLGLAVIFIYHGLHKVSDPGNEVGSAWMRQAEQPPPAAVQLAVAWGELLGGVAMALGFLTRLAAVGLAVIMVGAIYTVHWQHGFSLQDHGYEYNFAILVMCAAIFLLGGGTLAVDRWFHMRRKR
jgi:putative oxidoreductase